MTEFPPSHCPDCGGSLSSVAPARYHCRACGRSVYHAPTLAASVVVVDADGTGDGDGIGHSTGDGDGIGHSTGDGARDPRVLLGKRGVPPSEGRWTLPGGHVDLGEDPHVAAARELAEETGLEAHPGALRLLAARSLDPVDPAGRSAQKHVVSVDYVVPRSATTGTPTAADDLADVRWVSTADLADIPLAYDGDAAHLRDAVEALE